MGSRLYPGGSTSALREDLLAALGVLKVATAHQLWELLRPDWQDNKGIRNGLSDLARHGLVDSDGYTRPRKPPPRRGQGAAVRPSPALAGPPATEAARKLWRLTPAGLEAAAQLLPPERTMGGVARGAGRHGARHAMAVTETILGFIQPRTEDPPGIGRITSWTTEVILPVTGTVSSPAKGSPRPDAVLVAPEADLPFLSVEVDTGTETPAVIAAKMARYQRFFRRTITDANRQASKTPYWRTLYSKTDREGHPPVALVFTGMNLDALIVRIEKVADLSRQYWAAQAVRYLMQEPVHHYDYDDAIPVLATTLDRLRARGPCGRVWWRFGHAGRPESLRDALGNPDDRSAAYERDERRTAAREAQRRQEEAEREARRPVCAGCGKKYDQGWREYPGESRLCYPCAVEKEKREAEIREAEEKAREENARDIRGFFRFRDRR